MKKIDKNLVEDLYSLTPMQEGLLFHYLKDKNSEAYFEQLTLELDGEVDFDIFKRAWGKVILENQILRTTFRWENIKKPVQIVLKGEESDIRYQEVIGSGDEKVTLDMIKQEDRNEGFDLGEIPFRVRLIKVDIKKYYVIISNHHILFDGWSTGIVLKEFLEAYSNILDKKVTENKVKNSFKNVVMQYAKQNKETQREFWKDKLYDFKGNTKLSNEKESEVTNNHKISARINKDNLESYCRDINSTVASFLYGTWSVFISKFNNSEDIIFGTTLSGREMDVKDVNNMVGLFINTIPLRIKFQKNESIKEYFKRINSEMNERRDYEHTPLNEVMKASGKKSNSEIFDTIMVVENYPLSQLIEKYNNGFKISGFTMAEETHYDLTIGVSIEEELSISFDYDRNKVKQSLAEDMLKRYMGLIENISNEKFQNVEDINLLTEEEEKRILFDYNDTAHTYSEDNTVTEIFRKVVEKHRNEVAVVFGGEKFTYEQLDKESNRLANYLIDNGLCNNEIVGIMIEPSMEMVVGILGIIKAGGAYLPIDLEYPLERKKYLIMDSSMRFLVTSKENNENLKTEKLQQIINLKEDITEYSDIYVKRTLNDDNLFAIIYTSGTTGNPKGVMIEHKNVANLVKWFGKKYSIENGKNIIGLTKFTFDVSIEDMMGTLLNGAALYIPDSNIIFNKTDFIKYMNENGIYMINFVPSILKEMLLNEEKIESLKIVISGGEKLPKDLKDNLISKGYRVNNNYGPAETTVDALSWECESGEVYIGEPIGNVRAYVLDRDLKPMPEGRKGELCIGGAGVTRGYLNNEELTDNKFVEVDLSIKDRIYRTGDVASWSKDGKIEFFGRIDNQVKIRGYRIELDEIQKKLQEHENILDAVVIVRELKSGKTVLCSYYVEKEKSHSDEYKEYLKRILPEYMVPNYFIVMERLPLTSIGKVDKRKLPELKILESEEKKMPNNIKESIIQKVWGEVLGFEAEEIGINDNYFELGGDSITGIQIASKLHQNSLKIELKDLFEYPTIHELSYKAKEIKSSMKEKKEDIKGEVILGPIQQWFFEQNFVRQNHWNQSMVFDTGEGFKVELVEKVMNKIIEHHDTFRLRYKKVDDKWVQYYGEANNAYQFSRYDHSRYQEKESIIEQGTILDSMHQTLNIEKGPLIKIAYINNGRVRSSKLIFVIHHLVIDGYSWRILIEDFMNLYKSIEESSNEIEMIKSDSFKKWMIKSREYANSNEISKDIAFWSEYLPDNINDIPCEDENLSCCEKQMDVLKLTLDERTTNEFSKHLREAYNSSIYESLMMVFSKTLSNMFKCDVLMDVEGHGRENLIEDIDVSRTMGWFTSVYPFYLSKVDIEKEHKSIFNTLRSNLKRIPNKGMGFGLIKYLRDDKNINQKFYDRGKAKVSFNFLGNMDVTSKSDVMNYSNDDVGKFHSEDNHTNYIIEFDAMIMNGKINIYLKYSNMVFDSFIMETFIGQLEKNIETVINESKMQLKKSFVPEDFPLIDIDQNSLDNLLDENDSVDDMYTVSPVQQSMIFHYELSDDNTVTLEQTVLKINEKLDIEKFVGAWEKLLLRHGSLRTTFHWQNLKECIQVVHSESKIPYLEIDWSHKNQDESREKLEAFLIDDRKKGIEIDVNPLMRLSFIKLKNESYYVVWTHHHIQLDGWCVSTIMKELGKIYRSEIEGTEDRLDPAPQFREYIKWLKEKDLSKAKDFWTEELDGYIEPSHLSSIFDRNEEENGSFKTYEFELDKNILEELRAFSKKNHVTLNSMVQSSWAILMNRYLDKKDIVFGSTSSGRPYELKDSDKMIGCFMNTIPNRIKIEEDISVIEFIKNVQKNYQKLREYEYSPLSLIRSCSKMPRNTALYDLYDSIVIFENYPIDKALKNGEFEIKAEHLKIEEQLDYPMTLYCNIEPELKFKMLYETAHFSCSSIENMSKHFNKIIVELMNKAKEKLHCVEMLTDEEKEMLIHKLNDTNVAFEEEKLFTDLFKEIAEKYPDRVALEQGDIKVTFRELDMKSNLLSNWLIENGIETNDIVPVYLPKSPEMIIAIVAAMKAGGAFLPVDYSYPEDRVRLMVEDSNSKVIITQGNDKVKHFETKYKVFDNENSWANLENKITPVIGNDSKSLAYVIYTSGSTGKPKGVMMSHRAVMSHVKDMIERYQMSEIDKVLQFSSISFDISLEQVLTSLGVGSTLVLRDEKMWTPYEYSIKCREHELTISNLPTSYWNQIVNEWKLNRELIPEENLRIMVVGGEQMTPETVKIWKDICPSKIKLLNAYGPAETAMTSNLFDTDQFEKLKSKKYTPVGPPLGNRRMYIMDSQKRLVPFNVKGELYIAGIPISDGYVRREEITKDRFALNHFSNDRTEQIYRTGDIARYDEMGNIVIAGRTDKQIKIRTHRVEVEEIEHTIMMYQNINRCAVVPKKDDNGNLYLVGYYTVDISETVEENNLRNYLMGALPDYMVPTVLNNIEVMPYTPNGKIDKDSLILRKVDKYIQEEITDPQNEEEEKLLTIFKEVLPIKNIGTNTNFFNAGGDSLTAMMLVSKIKQSFNKNINLLEIFNNQTVSELSKVIGVSHVEELVCITKAESKENYQVSAQQRRLYFLNQLSDSTNYNISSVIRLKGPLNKEKFKQSLEKIVYRHESLRTSFHLVDGNLYQRVNDDVHINFEVIDRSDKEFEIDQLDSIIRHFSLEEKSLMRTSLIKINDSEHIAVFDIHHIIADGVSLGIIVEEFMKLYSGVELEKLEYQYKDYSHWQNEFLEKEEVYKQREYWVEKYKAREESSLTIPVDYERSGSLDYTGDAVWDSFGKKESEKIKKLSHQYNMTPSAVVFTILNMVVAKYCDQNQVVMGMPVSGRHIGGVKDIVGLFVNTVPVLNNINETSSLEDILADSNNTFVEAIGNQDYPIEELIDELSIERDINRNPIFDLLFVYQNMSIPSIKLGDLEVEEINLRATQVKFDMTFKFYEENEEVKIGIEYKAKLYERSTILRIIEKIKYTLNEVFHNRKLKFNDFSLVEEKVKENKFGECSSCKENIREIFERSISHNSDRIALRDEECVLTYNDLDNLSRRIMNRIIQSSEGKPVILCFKESNYAIAAMFAAVRAGIPYIPMDPQWPKERQEFIVQDSGAQMLLTNIGEDFDINGVKCINVSSELLKEPSFDREVDKIRLKEESPLYIIYTSGTTGKPKGVKVSHKNMVNYYMWFQRENSITNEDSSILTSSYAFDLGYSSIYPTILSGGTLNVPTKDSYTSPNRLIELLNKWKVSFMKVTPSFLGVIKDDINFKEENLKSLRLVVVGGEKIKAEHIKEIHDEVPHIEFMNHYGPTETTVGVIYKKLNFNENEFEEYIRRPVIGKTIDNTFAIILDKNDNLMPVGALGEICIGGACVSLGYTRSEKNTGKFIEHDTYGTIYKTGDIGRYLQSGEIEIKNRIDNQIKLNGYRIETDEIRNIVNSVEEIKDSVIDFNQRLNKLVCYYMGEVEKEELYEKVRNLLPIYMIPKVFVKIDEIPLNFNGKVDIKALRAKKFDCHLNKNKIGASSYNERKVSEIFEEVLKIHEIGIYDDFFELGGHSISAMSVVSKINERFKVNMKVSDIFTNRSVKELSNRIQELEKSSFIEITHAPEKDYYSLSSPQKRVYMSEMAYQNTTNYNSPMAFKVHGNISVDKIEESFKFLIERHASLRTCIKNIDGIPRQIVKDNVQFKVIASKVNKTEINEKLKAAIQPFNIEKAPLIRVYLMSVDEKEHYLMIDKHHIITDGYSTEILIQDFIALYNGEKLSDIELRYVDYAEWLNLCENSQFMTMQKEYWLKKMEGSIPKLNLPTDYPRDTLDSEDGGHVSVRLDDTEVEKLSKLSSKHKSTFSSTMLAILNVLIYRVTKDKDIIMGIPVSGRPVEKFEKVIGMFVNTAVMRNYLNDSMKVSDVLESIKNESIEVIDNQYYPFENLVNDLKVKREKNRNPLFDIMYVYQQMDDIKSKIEDINIESYNLKTDKAKVDLTFYVRKGADTELELEYKKGLFREETATRLIELLRKVIKEIDDEGRVSIGNINLEDSFEEISEPEVLEEIDWGIGVEF